jgi:hypothetical protein
MRWKLVLLLALLASGAAATALVRAQDTSGGAFRSRPLGATPLDASQLRTSGRTSGQIRQGDEFPVASDGPLQPAPEFEAGAGAPPASYNGIPSVLKRNNGAEAPAARTATAPSSPGGDIPPAGARPLGSLPAAARPLSSAAPAPSVPVRSTAPEAITPTEPPAAEATDDDPSSRRRFTTISPSATPSVASKPAADSSISKRSIETTRISTATAGKESILAGSAPQLRVEVVGSKSVIRGRPASYTLIAANVGEATARTVQVHLESRQAVEFGVGKTTHGGAEIHRTPAGGVMLLWSIPELPRGAKAELAITAVTRETRPFELLASWMCEPTVAAAPIEVLEPQLAMTLSGPKDVMFGETKIYTITLTNPGTGDVENVMLALAPLASSQEAPQPRSIGSLRAGERKEIPIQLTAREAGLLKIRAEATGDGGLRAEAAEEVMVRRAELQLTIEGPPLKYAGSPSEYHVRVVNAGNATAEEVTVVAGIPVGVEYTPGQDGGVVQTDGVAWRVGALAPRDERTFSFICTMHEEGDKEFVLEARAAGDLKTTATALTRVEALADLKLVVNDPPGAIPVGKEVTYEVKVINRGTKAASGVEISAFFSEGIEPTAADGIPARLAPGQVTAGPVQTLEAGAEVVLKIKAKADQPGTHIFRAVVQCANPETRLAAEDTTRFFGAGPGSASPTPAVDGPALSERPDSPTSPFAPVKR